MPFNSTSAGGNKVVPFFGGGQCQNPCNVIVGSVAPSTNNTESPIGTLYINITAPGTAYLCVANTGPNGSVTWDQLGLSTGTVGSLTGNSGGAITPSAGNINILGSSAITVTGSGSTLTISSAASGFVVNSVAGTSQAAVSGNLYITNNAGLTTVTLPAVAAVGDTYWVVGQGAGGWKIAQNAGQSIKFNSSSTTVGVTGSLASTNQFNIAQLMCITANTTFTVLDSSGTLTIV